MLLYGQEKSRGSQMNLRAASIIVLLILGIFASNGYAGTERTQFLVVCQELLNQARAYEARSTQHNRIAKVLMQQIETMARQPKSEATIAAMDQLFAQYDENRALENKFRELFRQASEEAKRCMKSTD